MKRVKVLALASAAVMTLAIAGCSNTKPAADTSNAANPAAGSSSSNAQPGSSAASAAPSAASPSAAPAGSASVSAPASAGSAAPVGKAGKNYKLAFIEGVQGDNFYITMQCGIEAAAKAMGVSATTQGPQQFDPTLQKPILDSVVATKPDAILIAPTNNEAMQAPLQQAAGQGIKVILVDTTTVDPSFAASQISSDNVGGGKAAFEAIKAAHPDGGKVLMVSVDPGITTTDARAQGFYDAAKADSKFTTIPVQYSHNDPSTAAKIVTAALQKNPDIVGIFAGNLFAAQGTATGIQQAGKVGKVTVVGFDAGPDQIAALKAGTVQALVAQQPYQIGQDGVQQAINSLEGKPVTAKIQTGFTIITQANVATTDAAYKSKC